jgi:hypothetical protein
MNETVPTVIVGVLACLGLTYLAVKVRQNQQRLRRTVGVIDGRYFSEMQTLFQMADSGELQPYVPEPAHG